MSLTALQIEKNTRKYFETGIKYGFINDKLTELLSHDLLKAPASPLESQYMAYEGGLIEHLLKVTTYAIPINDGLPAEDKVDKGSLIKVCLLHQIGKVKLFIPNESEWHRKNQGKLFEYNQDLVSMRVSERSILYAMNSGIQFTDEEFAAIINFDKIDDKQAEYHNSQLGEILKSANKFAINNTLNKRKTNAQ